jgi:DtxR family transcriptional regulator, Mn-dependent transcriptional regulator
MQLSRAEENYIKNIYQLHQKDGSPVNTNAIAEAVSTSAASVTDMLKKLGEKKLLDYERYYGVKLTALGEKTALYMLRKHRLWETFLYDKLHFDWDEVHELAEELEHIESNELIRRLDEFLGHPTEDPHGDPIPDEEGRMITREKVLLHDLKEDEYAVFVGLEEHTTPFLNYLKQAGITLGKHVKVLERYDYDGSMKIRIEQSMITTISEKVSMKIYVRILTSEL